MLFKSFLAFLTDLLRLQCQLQPLQFAPQCSAKVSECAIELDAHPSQQTRRNYKTLQMPASGMTR
jgi:hypothetical protein